jgi:hypothetical protein
MLTLVYYTRDRPLGAPRIIEVQHISLSALVGFELIECIPHPFGADGHGCGFYVAFPSVPLPVLEQCSFEIQSRLTLLTRHIEIETVPDHSWTSSLYTLIRATGPDGYIIRLCSAKLWSESDGDYVLPHDAVLPARGRLYL